jgi:hypothetical protein
MSGRNDKCTVSLVVIGHVDAGKFLPGSWMAKKVSEAESAGGRNSGATFGSSSLLSWLAYFTALYVAYHLSNQPPFSPPTHPNPQHYHHPPR